MRRDVILIHNQTMADTYKKGSFGIIYFNELVEKCTSFIDWVSWQDTLYYAPKEIAVYNVGDKHWDRFHIKSYMYRPSIYIANL